MSTSPLVIVQSNLVEKLTKPVAYACRDLGVDLLDFSSGDLIQNNRLSSINSHNPILIFGSIVFADRCRQYNPDLSKWVYWKDHLFDAKYWSKQLGKYFINHDGYTTTVDDFIASPHEEMHIRPCSEIKLVGDVIKSESKAGREAIAGLVITPAGLAERNIDGSTAIWVSHPKEIIAEIRVWIIDGKPAAASMYRLMGVPNETTSGSLIDEAMHFAGICHHLNCPDRHYVVDVALMSDNFYKVVEYNPIHSSGWYAADPKVVIQSLIDAG